MCAARAKGQTHTYRAEGRTPYASGQGPCFCGTPLVHASFKGRPQRLPNATCTTPWGRPRPSRRVCATHSYFNAGQVLQDCCGGRGHLGVCRVSRSNSARPALLFYFIFMYSRLPISRPTFSWWYGVWAVRAPLIFISKRVGWDGPDTADVVTSGCTALAGAAPPTGPLFYTFAFSLGGWVCAPIGQCLATLSEGECGAEPPQPHV